MDALGLQPKNDNSGLSLNLIKSITSFLAVSVSPWSNRNYTNVSSTSFNGGTVVFTNMSITYKGTSTNTFNCNIGLFIKYDDSTYHELFISSNRVTIGGSNNGTVSAGNFRFLIPYSTNFTIGVFTTSGGGSSGSTATVTLSGSIAFYEFINT